MSPEFPEHLPRFIEKIRPNPEFGTKLAITWKNEHFRKDFECPMASLSLTLNIEI